MAKKETILIKFKVDGKEITATEKDLKELQKATKKAEGGASKAGKGIDKMGVALKALGAVAAAAALFKFAEATVAAVKETENLARLAGISTTEFQKQAVAARSVGVEADKLADIYKDVDDKLGDFITTGAGPLADFFETIGKDMGVQIEDFKELSSDQALGLYVKTLEEANASQAEMTFFMEAIASDSALLTPLLRDNGKAMKELGDAATGVLSAETIEKAAVLDAKFKTLADTVKGQVTLAVVDASTAIATFLGLLDEVPNTAQEDALQANKVAAEQYEEALRLLAAAQKQGNEGAIAAMQALVDRTGTAVRATLSGVVAVNTKAEAEAKAAAEKKAADEAEAKRDQEKRVGRREREAAAEVAETKRKAAADAKAKSDAAEIEALRNLADPMKTYTDQLNRIRELMVLSANDPETMIQLAGAFDVVAASAKEAADEAERLANAPTPEEERLQSLAEKWETIKNEAKEHAEDVAELRELYVAGEISADELRAKVAEIGKTEDGEKTVFEMMADELAGLDHGIKKTTTESIVDMAGSFAEMAVAGEMSFGEMTKAILKDIAAMIIQMLILRAISSFGGGGADTGPAVDFQGRPITRDSGGQGSVGDAFLIGTGAQPELFVPQTSGQFIPKSQLGATFGGGGGGVQIGSINVVVKEKEGETSQEQAEKISKAIARDMKQMVQGEIVNQQRSGNILNPAGRTTFR